MAKKKWYRFLLYLGLEFLRRIVLILPRPVNQALAQVIGFAAYWILPKERAKIRRHLKEAFGPQTSDAKCRAIGQEAFIHLAKSGMDVFCFPKLTRERIERLVHCPEGHGKLDQALKPGKGAIVLTGHLGNWELLASYFRFFGYPGRLMGRRIYYEPFNRVLVRLRESALVSTMYRDESPRQVLEELKRNGIVGMSADQDIDSLEGIFVSFFGRPAWTPVGPAKVSLASGAPIVPGFMVHEKGKYRLFIEEPIWPTLSEKDLKSFPKSAPRTGASVKDIPKDEAIRLMTEQWSGVVERYVREYPGQWVWMHDRWKTKNAAKPSLRDSMPKEGRSNLEVGIASAMHGIPPRNDDV